MFRANQRQLVQEVNVGVVELRQLEINYYFNVNTAVGTQATLIGGFTYGLFTQNIPNDYDYAQTCLSAYFICSAITIFAAIHVILNTVLIQVYAPGLALHGPAGSMAIAAEVMADEQKQVMISFSIMIIFFSISTAICFWVVMDFASSIVSTFCFIVAVRQWAFHARRIYRKLYLDKEYAKELYKDMNRNSVDPLAEVEENQAKFTADEAQRRQSEQSEQHHPPSERNSLYKVLLGKNGQQRSNDPSASVDISSARPSMVAPSPKQIAMEGYLTKKQSRRNSVASKWSDWDRRYYTMTYGGVLTGYMNRQEYRNSKQSLLKERPIEIEDFNIYLDSNLVEVEESESRSVMTTSSVVADNKASRDLFRITMVSKDQEYLRKIVFRCDTEEELQMWSEALTSTAPGCIVKTSEEKKINF